MFCALYKMMQIERWARHTHLQGAHCLVRETVEKNEQILYNILRLTFPWAAGGAQRSCLEWQCLSWSGEVRSFQSQERKS